MCTYSYKCRSPSNCVCRHVRTCMHVEYAHMQVYSRQIKTKKTGYYNKIPVCEDKDFITFSLETTILVSKWIFSLSSFLVKKSFLDQIFFCDPVVIESICYRTRANRLINESIMTRGLREIWTGTRPNFFLRSIRNRVDLLSYESKTTDKRGQYD